MELSKQEFDLLRSYINEVCGLTIHQDKNYLVRQRLEPLVLKAKCSSFYDYYQKLIQAASPQAKKEVIEAITTNETFFFRDNHPFEAFRNVILPELGKKVYERKERAVERKGAKVRIWSAASSTGQEAYTLAMLTDEYIWANSYRGISRDDFEFMATDISSEVLAKAITGKYNQIEIQRGLPPAYRAKYFEQEEDGWRIKDEIRSMVEFRQINLTQHFTMLGGFDVIFCRNVLIYFSNEANVRIFDQFHQMISEKGYLILGSTENVYGTTEHFESNQIGETLVYRKRN